MKEIRKKKLVNSYPWKGKGLKRSEEEEEYQNKYSKLFKK
jgi:hypothetical protein